MVFGAIAWYRLNKMNRLKVTGAEHLVGLDDHNVLFVSNHQTYFMDVSAMYLSLCHTRRGHVNQTHKIGPIARPVSNLYYIAAKETMKSGLLPRALALSGSVSIDRTWREAGKAIKRGVNSDDLNSIRTAIKDGWVITFPQGTTKPFAPGRRGTAHLIKELQPVVIPVVIDGFRRAFDKKGLRSKKRGVALSMNFKAPLVYDAAGDTQELMDRIMDAIEQTPKYQRPFRKFEPDSTRHTS